MDVLTMKLDVSDIRVIARALEETIKRAKTPKEQAAVTEELAMLLRLAAAEAGKHDITAYLPPLPSWAIEAIWVAHGAARRLPYVEADREKLTKEVRSLKGKVAQARAAAKARSTEAGGASPKTPGRGRLRPGRGETPAAVEEPVAASPAAVTAMDEEGSGADAGSR